MDNATKLARLYEECAAYFDGIYAPEKKVYVFGDGSTKAKIVMIGEAPGEQETIQGKPFVGKAGKNLDEFLRESGFERSELYISNTVKIRPSKISDAGRVVNRPPTREEIELFLPWLKKEISIVAPECIVTLGNVALRALLGREYNIGAVHGQRIQTEFGLVIPLYHPASVIYNPALRETYLEDVRSLRELKQN